ncbi:MAG: hypothetical protein JM58_16340 [Peptococcaceae bacterium BICA1-8]|nr:MAG: hypothetical protein JM58_16340 [Peptococcaceae bacterium BICA1-8]
MSLQVTINGIDRSLNINPNSFSKTDALNDEVDTCIFTFETNNIAEKPIEGQEVIVTDGADRIFGGHIRSAPEDEVVPGEYVYQVDCIDYQRNLDKYLVVEKYENMYAGDIIKDIITKYCAGFTSVNVKQGVLIKGIPFNYKYPGECSKELAELTGHSWYVDYFKDVHFFDQFTNLAPFNLDDSESNYSNLEITADITQLRNRVFFRGGTYLSDPFPETHEGGKEVWNLGYKPHDLSVTVNSIDKTAGIENINAAADYDFLFNYQEKHVIPGALATTSSDVVKFTYKYDVPVLTVQDDVDSINRMKALEGGDGVYEHIIVDKEVTNKDLARQISQADLDQHSNPLLSGNFRTNVKGLRSGQLIRIKSTKRNIDNDFLIRKVIMSVSGDKYVYHVEIASKLKGIEDLLIQLFNKSRQIEIRDDEVLDKLLVLRDSLSLKDALTVETGAPESRVGFARVGYSEVG